MKVLVIGPEERTAIKRVKEFASEWPLPQARLLHLMAHPEDAPGHTPGYVCVVPMGFRCVFTHEEQPVGWCRHLSVSVMKVGRLPNEPAMEMIMEAFGFTKKHRELAKEGMLYVMDEVHYPNINVLEKL